MTKEQVEQQYRELAAEVGDLYFTIDNLQQHLAHHQARLKACKEKRLELLEAHKKAIAEVVDAT